MSITNKEISAMAGRGVVVIDELGQVIALGMLSVSAPNATETGPTVELFFETETSRRTLRLPPEHLPELAASWHDGMYRYQLLSRVKEPQPGLTAHANER